MALDDAKLQSFVGQFVNDFGAVMHAATIVVGDELGLYKAMRAGALTAEALAEKTGIDPAASANGSRPRLAADMFSSILQPSASACPKNKLMRWRLSLFSVRLLPVRKKAACA